MSILVGRVTDSAYLVERPTTGPPKFDHEGYCRKLLSKPRESSLYVRKVCQRHLADLDRQGEESGIYFDEESAYDVLKFAWFFWTVTDNVKGIPVLFDPLPWQKFVIYMMFGWKVHSGDFLYRQPDSRRYRTLYLETAKGSGKSPLLSMIMVYMVTVDKLPNGSLEPLPRGYICASNRKQANNTMGFIEFAVEHSHILAAKFTVSQAAEAARHMRRSGSNSRWPLISTFAYSGKVGLSGPTPSINLFEELHEHWDDNGKQMLEKGVKTRVQPINAVTTNAGEISAGFAYDEHLKAIAIAKGQVEDDTYLPLVFSVDENDDPMVNKDCWRKANPSLGATIRMDYLVSEWNKAKHGGVHLRNFLRLNMGMWPKIGTVPFVPREVIEKCNKVSRQPESVLATWHLFLGLDLAPLRDLSSLAMVFVSPDFKRMQIRTKVYTAADTIFQKEQRVNAPLLEYRDEGHLTTTPGAVLDYRIIVEDIVDAIQQYNVVGMAYDDYDINTFWREFTRTGLTYGTKNWHDLLVVNHPQGHRRQRLDVKGLTMGGSINCFEHRLLKETENTCIEHNPMFNYAVAIVEVESNKNRSRVFVRETTSKNAFGYIDPLVATTMAVGYADFIGMSKVGKISQNIPASRLDSWIDALRDITVDMI